MVVFTWATYNGATFYIDVFGKKFEKELYALKKEVGKWQATPEGRTILDEKSPSISKLAGEGASSEVQQSDHVRSQSLENIPLLDQKEGSTAKEERGENADALRRRDTNTAAAS